MGLSPTPSVSVCLSVCPESVLWQNGRLHPDAVWVVSGVFLAMGVLDGGDRRMGRGSFGVNLGRSIVTDGAFATRSSQITSRSCFSRFLSQAVSRSDS